MNRVICILLFFSLLQSCTRHVKYEMQNMLPETVDVTEYVESGTFIPDSCEGRIDKLIKVKPRMLDKDYEARLEEKLRQSDSFKSISKIKPDSLYKTTLYQYSYFVNYEPIDVYKTKIKAGPNTEKEIFIRLTQAGKIYSGFSENSWVLNKCD